METATATMLLSANMAVSYGSKTLGNRGVKQAQEANIELQTQQQQMEAEQKATELTRQTRQYLSYALASSAMGVGGTTGGRNVSQEAMGNLSANLKQVGQTQRFLDISSTVSKSLNQAQAFNRQAQAVATTANEGLGLASSLGLFDKKDQ